MHISLSATCMRVKTPSLEAAGVVLSGPIGFELKPGEINVIRGGNGVGKSTLLRLMSNSLPGQCVLFKPEFGLRDELLVHTHLQIVLSHLRTNAHSVESLLERVGLANWQYERIGTLSSGQRARLGLCSLLAGQFKVWLLDEPLNALDQEGIATLAGAVATHFHQGGIVFMATHVDASVLTQHLAGVPVKEGRLEQGKLLGGFVADTHLDDSRVDDSLAREAGHAAKVNFPALLQRDWAVTLGNPQALLWGALFHWMVLSFFGIGLGKPSTEFAQVAVWVSLLLALMLGAKDWFAEDHRTGWLGFVAGLNPDNIALYWLVRVVFLAFCQILVLVPVTGLVALQLGLHTTQTFDLALALSVGIWAVAPLLGLIVLLVMLTRGGAVLVYLLALPLLVPVLIFGLEASQANGLGRSAIAPLAVLASLGLLGCLLGPFVAKRLVGLIQE
ncbi:heme exporter protein CcmB [Limnobacter sp. P1]|uniref:heme exporter protein CcmB n=1 Tax=Limnobacter olei TaxID=3031298 RepID=UPI0023B14A60|nr:heme exporter protein CcmB [Limnobacter sp. P1]